MRIARIAARAVTVPLTRPYAIAGHSWDSVEFVILEIATECGQVGYGQASPAPEVTGETCATALAALGPSLAAWLGGKSPADPLLLTELAAVCPWPAARAAVDMALCDLLAKAAGVPFVTQLGRVHEALPTSITIGQKNVDETIAEAAEYLARGFSVLKVKTGTDVAEDVARLRALRRTYGQRITLRADANQGYDRTAMQRFLGALDGLDLEMIEQPMAPGEEAFLRTLPAPVQRLLVADESVLDVAGLDRLLADGCPYGIVNIKLMKCGGPRAALRLAQACEQHGREVMWGCNDESVLGIAAALHVAYASKATRYLDLDGSLDLAIDPFEGGFALAGGVLRTVSLPGFGVCPSERI
jgi:L-alanine-DL-glutamate epimerase-like enolase superfamily enzyme